MKVILNIFKNHNKKIKVITIILQSSERLIETKHFWKRKSKINRMSKRFTCVKHVNVL